MITDKDRETLGPLLGTRYTPDVIKMLKKNNDDPEVKTDYSRSFITKVYKGKHENADVEKAIFDLADMRKDKKEGIQYMRNRLTSESA